MSDSTRWSLIARHAKTLSQFARALPEARRELMLRGGDRLCAAIWWAKNLPSSSEHDDKLLFQRVLKLWLTTLRELLDDGRLNWDYVRSDYIKLAESAPRSCEFGECLYLMMETAKVYGSEHELRLLIGVRVRFQEWRDEMVDRMLCEKYGLVYRPPAERYRDIVEKLGLDTVDLGGDPPPIRSYQHRS